jgi:hypothetical protein
VPCKNRPTKFAAIATATIEVNASEVVRHHARMITMRPVLEIRVPEGFDLSSGQPVLRFPGLPSVRLLGLPMRPSSG